MAKQSLAMTLLLFLYCSISHAQSPAQAPAPSAPTNVTKVLEKAGQFTTFIKLLKATQTAERLNAQLNNSNQGVTIFAPTDNAFANLKPGALNSLSSQQQLQILQFHILPTLYTMSQFQTASNPLHTQAGNSDDGEFPLNVTTSGNQVNITTGVVDATVANTIHSDSQLAVYQVDQVLLPMAIFGTTPAPSPAPGPSTSKHEKSVRAADTPSSSSDASGDTSSVPRLNMPPLLVFISIVLFVASSNVPL